MKQKTKKQKVDSESNKDNKKNTEIHYEPVSFSCEVNDFRRDSEDSDTEWSTVSVSMWLNSKHIFHYSRKARYPAQRTLFFMKDTKAKLSKKGEKFLTGLSKFLGVL